MSLELIAPWLDEKGLLHCKEHGSTPPDWGDSLADSARLYYLTCDLDLRDRIYDHLMIYPGVYRRSWNQWFNPLDVSRDQLVPVICSCLYVHSDNFKMDLFPNKDLVLPQNKNAFKRQYSTPENPTLFGDFCLTIDTIIQIIKTTMDEDDVADHLNLSIMLHQSRIKPTFLSKVARWIYRKWGKGQRCWEHYYRAETGSAPLYVFSAKMIAEI